MKGSAHNALGHGRLELAAKLAHLEIMEGGAHDTLGHGRLELAAKLAHLEVMEGRAHNTLGHGWLELAAKLAHFHLEIPQHIILLLPYSVSDESIADPDPDQSSKCCGSEFFHPGSEFFPSRILDPHQRI
jgi:hypothetical protein